MTIAIFGTCGYWNDGHAWKDFSERGELADVVANAAQLWFHHQEEMIIEEAIGVDVDEVQILIEDRYNGLIKEDQRRRRIETLRVSVRHCQQWLANRDAETERLTKQLAEHTAELYTLTGGM